MWLHLIQKSPVRHHDSRCTMMSADHDNDIVRKHTMQRSQWKALCSHLHLQPMCEPSQGMAMAEAWPSCEPELARRWHYQTTTTTHSGAQVLIPGCMHNRRCHQSPRVFEYTAGFVSKLSLSLVSLSPSPFHTTDPWKPPPLPPTRHWWITALLTEITYHKQSCLQWGMAWDGIRTNTSVSSPLMSGIQRQRLALWW